MSDHYYTLVAQSVKADAAAGWDWLSVVERAKAGLLACGVYGSALIDLVNFAQSEASRVLPQRATARVRVESEPRVESEEVEVVA